MLKTYLSVLSIILLHHTGLAQELIPGMYNDFAGKIGDRNISLSIYLFENSELKGNYCSSNDDTRVQLAGTYSINNKLTLTQSINGKANGYLEGKVIMDDSLARLEGTWMDISKTKKTPFMLRLASGITATFGYRYKNVGSEEGVENFMKLLKSAIISKDRQWIANHVKYPLKTHLDGVTPIEIKGKDQLIANFETIFYSQYVDTIESLCACNLFQQWESIMLGDGQVCIAADGLALDGFRIVSVDNSRK